MSSAEWVGLILSTEGLNSTKGWARENLFYSPDSLWTGTSVFFCLQTQTWTYTLVLLILKHLNCGYWDSSVSVITGASSLSIYLSSISYLYVYTFTYLYRSYGFCFLENPVQYRDTGHMRLPLISFTFSPIFCIKIWSIFPRY